MMRDGKVFIKKTCPDCGATEQLVSGNAAAWQRKRDLYRYDPAEDKGCALNCTDCGHDHHQTAAFLDVTSRCNLSCPICLANIPGMHVDFDPPLSYFQKVVDQLATWNPKPRINLFGGEPTIRKDLFEIIAMIKKHKMKMNLVTNGIALANEEFCQRVLDEKVEILFAFDGRDPVIYEQMRGSRRSYDLKLKAIENMQKMTRRRHTWVCTLAVGLNDQHIPDYFQFVHEHRSIVRRIFFIPLTEMWDAGLYETKQMTTPEEVEGILQQSFPKEKLEFIPCGLFDRALPAARFFNVNSIQFAGAHPNCEQVAYLISDGERFRPIGEYLKRPVWEVVDDFIARAEKLNPKLKGLDPTRWSHRWIGRLKVIMAYRTLATKSIDFKKIFRGNRFLTSLRMFGGLLIGRKTHNVMRKHSRLHESLAVVILPFEEWDSVESGRMRRCTSVFVYLDPKTEKVERVPFCMWCHYRKDTFKQIGEKWPPEKSVRAQIKLPTLQGCEACAAGQDGINHNA